MWTTAIHEYRCEPPRYKIAVQGQGADYKDALGIVLDRLETGPLAKVRNTRLHIVTVFDRLETYLLSKVEVQTTGMHGFCFRPRRNRFAVPS